MAEVDQHRLTGGHRKDPRGNACPGGAATKWSRLLATQARTGTAACPGVRSSGSTSANGINMIVLPWSARRRDSAAAVLVLVVAVQVRARAHALGVHSEPGAPVH